MRLFQSRKADAAYDTWMEAPEVHEEDGCWMCHEYHRREGVFDGDCEACDEERCLSCGGVGLIGNEPCPPCSGSGRTKKVKGWTADQ